MLALFLLLFVSRATVVPVWGSSEAREAHVTELVAEATIWSGEWILPLRDGFVPSKPPLLHWLGSILVSLFGFTGLQAARFVSAIAAVLSVAMVANYSAGGVSGQRANASWWLTAGVMFSSYGFFSLASDARVDMLLCFLVTGAGLSVLSGLERIADALPAGREAAVKSMQYRTALWCGFAVLAKGPLGLAFPALFALVVVAFGNRTSLWSALVPRLGPSILLLLIALPWYLAATAQGGDGFVERQIIFENIARFTGGEGVNSKPWHFYLPVFISTAFPWSIVAALGVFSWIFSGNRSARSEIGAAWVIGIFMLSLSEGKRASYLLVLLPWVAIYAAQLLERHFSSVERAFFWDRLLRRGYECFGLASVLFAGLIFCEREFRGEVADILTVSTIIPALIIDAACLLGWLVCVVVLEKAIGEGRSVQRIGVRLCALAGVAICLASTGLSVKAAMKGYEQVAARIVERSDGAMLYGVRTRADERLDPMLYLVRRPVAILSPEIISANLPDTGFILADKRWLTERGFSNEMFLEQFPPSNPEIAMVMAKPIELKP